VRWKLRLKASWPGSRPLVGVSIVGVAIALCTGLAVETWRRHYLWGLATILASLALIYAGLWFAERAPGGRTR